MVASRIVFCFCKCTAVSAFGVSAPKSPAPAGPLPKGVLVCDRFYHSRRSRGARQTERKPLPMISEVDCTVMKASGSIS